MHFPEAFLLARQTIRFPALCLLTLLPSVMAGADEGWGGIRGRIVFDGAMPEAEPLQITRDEEVCGVLGLKDQSLLVDAENGGLKDVAVWLDARAEVPIHPDLQTAPKVAPRLDNRGCLFVPHVLAVRVGQPVDFSNSDPIAHNAAVYARRNQPFSEVIPQSAPVQKVFGRPETQPIRVDCSIHSWMKAWIIIVDHPYVAVSNSEGEFQISQIPAGEWTFKIWHERPGMLESVPREVGADSDGPDASSTQPQIAVKKGTIQLKIVAGEVLDLGEIRVGATQF